jgi:hypothetical protein
MRSVCAIVIGALVTLGAAAPVHAQPSRFEWRGTERSVEIRGDYGSVRAVRSEDAQVHVVATPSDTRVKVEIRPTPEGVTFCAVSPGYDCGSTVGSGPMAAERRPRIDFEVRVPESTRFSASMIGGNVTVDRVGSDISVATIDGDVTIMLPQDPSVDFQVNTIRGSIESDFPISVGRRQVGLTLGPPLTDGPARWTVPQMVQGTIGSGGQAVHVVTVNGEVRLRLRP